MSATEGAPTHGPGRRRLIVNADDFGLSPGVNRGILTSHERGIVTSASLMVRWPAAAEAAAYGRAHPELGIGLHIDLCEWAYRGEEWSLDYEVVPTDDPRGARDEVLRQLDAFRLLMGREPTHVDSHQHVHREEPLRTIVQEIADALGVPLRHCAPHVAYRGDFYGQSGKGYPYPDALTVRHLVSILARLPEGITELGCHPGLGDDVDSMYCSERSVEVRVLCDPSVRAAVINLGVELCSFADLTDRERGSSPSDR
jgi:predicted glycoside hydrolase/deacetylase ChbG (UPF0249 family)